MGRENKVGTMPTCYCLIFMCCQPCLPNFHLFKVVYHEHPFAFSPSAMSVMPQSQEHILGWPYLRQIKSDYHGWLSRMTSSEDPFSLASGPPKTKPTTVHIKLFFASICPLLITIATKFYLRSETLAYILYKFYAGYHQKRHFLEGIFLCVENVMQVLNPFFSYKIMGQEDSLHIRYRWSYLAKQVLHLKLH